MFKEEFSTDYYIVSRSLAYHCTGEGDICNKNIKPSDNYLIIPFYKYLLIGWAAE